MRKYGLIIILLSIYSISALADEGMWMIGNLNKRTEKALKHAGTSLSAKQIYDPNRPSLSDAVVNFGGFCTGVVVSEDGLVFTNHHCGFDAVQQHSTMAHDYVKDGFVARSRGEELPNPELYVRFLLRTEDVTGRVLSAVNKDMDEAAREVAVDSMRLIIMNEVYTQDSTLVAEVDACYAGNEYWLSVYRDYTDVRLVFAPPSSIGKFGWDTDNWMWPRHTGDFSVFRIYADRNNQPADYSPDNVPYHPKSVAKISLKGYKEGDFCMTIGYPGSTERFLSSYGIEEMMQTQNQSMIDMRGVKQEIWKREMRKRPEIALKYAAKYDESSNYWKNSIGVNQAIRKLNILEKKQMVEQALQQWIQQTADENGSLMQLIPSLELNYKDRRAKAYALSYFSETFLRGIELFPMTLQVINFDLGGDNVQGAYEKVLKAYDDYDAQMDKEVFVAMLKAYKDKVPAQFLPDFYKTIDEHCGGNVQLFADSIYSHTLLTTTAAIDRYVQRDSTLRLFDDPAVTMTVGLIEKMFEILDMSHNANANIERDERRFNAAVRRMYYERNYYPDANFTMRLSFGNIRGYVPFDGAEYNYYTTSAGILQKVREYSDDPQFDIQPEVLSLVTGGQYGRYANRSGDMSVCFISNNDITGGNSGSPMFNHKGELIGLAFDGNWEAMSSDVAYEPHLQRCIGVDVRYMLFLMERFGHADALIQELLLK